MREKKVIEIEQLRRLEPIASLSEERLQELIPLVYVEKLAIGGSLFREGDIDNQTIYLLAGDIQLSSSDGQINKTINEKSEDARFPLDDSQPRQASCSALTRVEVLRIDNSVLDYMMMWDQMAVSESKEAELKQARMKQAEPVPRQPKPVAQKQTEAKQSEAHQSAAKQESAVAVAEKKTESVTDAPQAAPPPGTDRSWIRKMRHIMAFKAMPPANIKRLLERMESVEVHEGDTIIQQGEPGDYYYVLTEGEALVTRTVELARLEAGRSFGEEALISEGNRNASVTMLSDGIVMRLSKEDFNQLLQEPLLDRVSPGEARLRVANGACWLDVRHAREYHHSHLPGAVNIPLHELRMRLDELKQDTPYVCYCSTGRRSAAAAFILAQKGFQASVLNGGVKVMAQDLRRSAS